jgi:hypothetical protein
MAARKKKKKKTSSGGKAEATGADYETLVGAWYCHALLVGTSTQPLFDLPATSEIKSVHCQTDAPIDDVNAVTSDDGIVFVQAKRTVALSTSKSSPLASALDQFVRQHQACDAKSSGKFWSRPLEPLTDRLVLATRGESSAKIIEVLPRLLRGLRDRAGANSLLDVATSQAERAVARTIEQHVKRSWKSAYERNPTAGQLAALIRLIWVQQLDLESGKRDRKFLLDQFRINILVDPVQASTTFSELYRLVARFRADRSGTDRGPLLLALSDAGIKLQALPDYRSDVAALKTWTAARLQKAPAFIQLLDKDSNLKIERSMWPAFRSAANQDSFLLVGEPGAGKSGLTYRLGLEALTGKQDVVFLPVDLLNIDNFSALNSELRISHNLADVLANWPGSCPGLLIVDALDAARRFETQNILREVVAEVLKIEGCRWRVVASVRRYDLRQGNAWADMFRGPPPIPADAEREFSGIRHISVRMLQDAEIDQMASTFPQLTSAFQGAFPRFRDLLRNIFNLHLLADLLRHGATASELSVIRTQPDLLDRYWRHRVRRDDGKHDDREIVLTSVLNEMIGTQSLQVLRAKVRSGTNSEALVDLERNDILRAESRGGVTNEDVLLFSHHVLFDYAAARLIFQRGRDAAGLVSRLRAKRELALMLGPSLSIALADAWSAGADRAEFWNLALALARETGLPGVAQLAAPMVIAELATSVDDLSPLLRALAGPAPEKGSAENLVPHLIGAVFVRSTYGHPLTGVGAGPWMQLADRLLESGSEKVVFSARSLLMKALEGQ